MTSAVQIQNIFADRLLFLINFGQDMEREHTGEEDASEPKVHFLQINSVYQ